MPISHLALLKPAATVRVLFGKKLYLVNNGVVRLLKKISVWSVGGVSADLSRRNRIKG